MIDWESKFEEHRRILEEEDREREKRIEKSDRMGRSWKLAKLCRDFIRKNSNNWRGEEEERRKKREKEREKVNQKQRAEEQKLAFRAEDDAEKDY